MNVRVYEAGETVGGTWYWNCYPGARCDSRRVHLLLHLGPHLLQEWEWSERYPEQPEILRYLEHVAATPRPEARHPVQHARHRRRNSTRRRSSGRVHTDKGETVDRALSDRRRGQAFGDEHAASSRAWKIQGQVVPHQPLSAQKGVDFTGKRVAVVGTGATAVQAIPEIAQQAKHLTVFQRTANYCVPARNGKVDPELVKARKADYNSIVKRIRESFFGQEHYFIPKSVLEVTPRSGSASSTGCGTRAASPSGSPTTRTCSSARRPTTSAPTTSSARSAQP